MSDLYNELIDELEKCDIFVRYSIIEPKTILDLSEHDKPFKVKIRELEESYQKNTREIRALEKEVVNYKQAFEDKCKDYDFTSELLNKYVAENESLKKRIQELDTIDAMRIDENKELKQRIAELESKETEKTTKYTTVIVAKEINGQTYVTLDDFTFVVNALQAQIGT